MALRSKFMNENQLSRKRSAYSRESDGETESRPKPRTLRSPLSPLSSPTPSNTPLKSRSLYPASSPATRIFSAPHKSLPDSDSDSDSGIDLRRAQQTPTAKRRRGPTTRARSKTSNDDELADASYSSEDEDEEGAMRNDFDLVIETPVRKARVPLANRTTNNKTNARALPPTPPTVSVSPLTATAVYRPTLTACRQTLQTPPTPPSTPCSASSSSVSPSSPDTSPTPSSTSTSVRQPTKSISLPFHRSHRPPNLPCRDTERSTILDFLRASCVGPNAKPAGLYVCGVPGTGKTAVLGDCVAKVVDESEGNLLLVDVNCATLTDPKTVFVRALSEIRAATGRTEGWRAPRSGKDAQRELEAEVCRGGKRIILLLDEIDHLLPPPTSRSHADVDAANASSTAAGEALHGVFALPHLSGSRCVVVGIANALDLAERWMPRLRARGVAPSLVVFTPYTVPQITEILKERVNVAAAAMGIDVSGAGGAQPLFQSAAVELAARKTAGTGDLRKALDVCRQAIELAESEFRRAILNASSSPSPNTPATPTPTPALKRTEFALFLCTGNYFSLRLSLHPMLVNKTRLVLRSPWGLCLRST
ncbi:P-loop containing nucleoside triphosphate hydrolase protein [Gonapodya prolifera JEL478]|uniref:p-loop containing nucleoside triphosphate hydrolase protein n=1 Tax=Gonapodya prolifera (strain JEL478) TaxID=1344416 RepID=A0A139AVG0_GONPJ|nr:P-loop containing nucleoside triphosphate hydrolase protein [Gonapodya prolifera JEL478]|eukprot:KXS20718.1 P-loop containing nucleoside triphosphate hydrolase protein [Gonapodya prolifera JEL478]